MDEKSFPYRLDNRARSVLAGMMLALIQGDGLLQSSQMPITLLFENKENGLPLDSPIYMMRDGIRVSYRLNNIADTCPKCLDWLKKYNQFISGRLKSSAVPAAERCMVQIEAGYDGTLKYYFYYMMRYEDNSLAQDMPQGILFATEPLFRAEDSVPALPATQAAPAAQAERAEQASWT
jgi:hypothetical protein